MLKRLVKTVSAAILLALAVLALFALGSAVLKADERPQCSVRGWYKRIDSTPQYPVWDFVDPSKAGYATQGLGAHSWIVYGNDGIQYAILDQCHADQNCTGSQGLYKKPDDPTAAAEWAKWYTAPDAEGRRHAFGYYNASMSIPSGVQHYALFTLSELPVGFQRSFGGPLGYNCSGIPTPLPTTPTRVPTGPARTATRRPTVPPISGGGCPPGAPCPVTNTPTKVVPTKTNTPPATATATATRPPATIPPAASASPTIRPTTPPLVSTVVYGTNQAPTPTGPTPTPGPWYSNVLPVGCTSKK